MKRTITTDRTVFHLQTNGDVTFDFRGGPAIVIRVPGGTGWRMPFHWHYHRLDAREINCLSGRLHIHLQKYDQPGSEDDLGSTGFSKTFKLDDCASWGPGYNREDALDPANSTLEVVLVATPVLHRNLCSMSLDQDIFPSLDSTPLWLKMMFGFSAPLPTFRQYLLELSSHVQRQLTLYAHDYYEYHGIVRFTLLWPWMLPGRSPKLLRTLERRSMYWISIFVAWVCYWFGALACGMKPLYPEYTPVVVEDERKRAVEKI
ncbi:hypothetical protein CKM354_001061700 [Cercospora kikuchii]|uniref:Uncharacterized protein n=1 Tax=Cercospora kikuchii TaxID=84275 RepID=A0A9P3CRD0_9PEZI|nr:uncharacterized protein CKM354_001061700 [Cercospora kikuchii]GIZ47528.1 hypothetical protein CKM354_001061700 [Cercospora kikuchii]